MGSDMRGFSETGFEGKARERWRGWENRAWFLLQEIGTEWESEERPENDVIEAIGEEDGGCWWWCWLQLSVKSESENQEGKGFKGIEEWNFALLAQWEKEKKKIKDKETRWVRLTRSECGAFPQVLIHSKICKCSSWNMSAFTRFVHVGWFRYDWDTDCSYYIYYLTYKRLSRP